MRGSRRARRAARVRGRCLSRSCLVEYSLSDEPAIDRCPSEWRSPYGGFRPRAMYCQSCGKEMRDREAHTGAGAEALPFPPGHVLERRYELEEVLSYSASGPVLRGRDRLLKRPVTIELLG